MTDQIRLPYDERFFLRHRQCHECHAEFTYEVGRGTDRYFCSDFCRTRRRHRRAKAQPLCVFEGCLNPRISARSGLCNSCYYRIRRTGTIERRVWNYRSLASNGYIMVRNQEHPLATPNGSLYEHRKVLFDAIGHGPHPCHWCGAVVQWIKGRCVRGALVADHLDGDKTNNAPGNLVAACNRCNAARGLFMKWVYEHQDDPVLWQMYLRHKAG